MQRAVHRGLLLFAVGDRRARRRGRRRARRRDRWWRHLSRNVCVPRWRRHRAAELRAGLLLPLAVNFNYANVLRMRGWNHVRGRFGAPAVRCCVRYWLLLCIWHATGGVHLMPRGDNLRRWQRSCVLRYCVSCGVLLPREFSNDAVRGGEVQRSYGRYRRGDMHKLHRNPWVILSASKHHGCRSFVPRRLLVRERGGR